MNGCLSLDDLSKINALEIDHLVETAKANPPTADYRHCEALTKAVRSLEASLVHSYKIAVYMAKQSDDPREHFRIWNNIVGCCDWAVKELKRLSERYPDCGTPQLYDLALNYMMEAAKRRELNSEAMSWMDKEIPQGLFPETS